MNIKEIAEITNSDKTTVQRWIKKIPDAKRIELDAKCIEAVKNQTAADFTLEETIEIIRAGGNNTLADLLLENAKNKNALISTIDNKDSEIIKALQFLYKEVAEIKQNQLKLSAPTKTKKPLQIKAPEPIITKEYNDELCKCVVEWNGEKYIVQKSHNDYYKWEIREFNSKIYQPIKGGFYSRRDAINFVKRRLGK